MPTQTMTAPLAVIKCYGFPVGRMKNIRITETIRRGKILGLGSLIPVELPAIEWNGTMTSGFYNIDFKEHPFVKNIDNTSPLQMLLKSRSILRKTTTVDGFVNTVLLQEDGLIVDIYQKVRDTQDPATGIISALYENFATVAGAFISNDGFDINEGQISGRDSTFEYLQPIIFPT